jgi:hypothetical protein
MGALKTANYDGIDAKVIFVDVVLNPIGGIGSKSVLFTTCIDPMINDMVNFVVITQTNREPMNFIKGSNGIKLV